MSSDAQYYRQMSMQIDFQRQKIVELEGEKFEHELVVKALEPMADDRKCYRLIGGVLVQRTKKEVYPAVKQNLEHIVTALETLKQDLAALEQQSIDFRQQALGKKDE